jgi:NADPH:quinone reductase-like Zn-dependent oxidoreductase
MRGLCWHGPTDLRCDTVPDPKIEHPDAIIRVTSCAICGSDLHLYDGFMPGMQSGDIMGHEFMGEVVEVGSENKKLKVGDRVCRLRSFAVNASNVVGATSPFVSVPTATSRPPTRFSVIQRLASLVTPT